MTAHVLAWVVVLGLVFGPVYQGESVTAAAPGAPASEPTKTTATLIEVNGWRVLPILLVPAALTGLALEQMPAKPGAGCSCGPRQFYSWGSASWEVSPSEYFTCRQR